MNGVLNDALYHAVEALNFSVVGILICFICMTVYILNITILDDGISSVVHFKKPIVPKVNYEPVVVPFIFSLEKSQNGHDKSLSFTLRNTDHCLVHIHWHVTATLLKSSLYLTWPQFIDQVNSADSLESFSSYKVGDFSLTNGEPHNIVVPIPELPVLGKPPRTKFPLMVCIQRTDDSEKSGSSVGALVAIIHISDEDCPMPNIILYQYLKQYSGQLTQLKPLYTQSSEVPKDTGSLETISVEEACVICKVLKPVRALLPCRHVCVCSLCFPHIESCPMCRSDIEAFFVTNEREAKRQDEMGQESQNGGIEARHRSFLSNMNGVLSSILGLEQN